jgi:hypothetical protein
MPQDNPGALTAAQYTDVLAYLLQFHKFPAGQTELASDLDTLKKVKLEWRKP